MRVLLLGGTGVFGQDAAPLLADSNLVTEIGIASRRLEAAQSVASELGHKGRAVSVDINDESRLTSISGDYDIVVNTAGPTFEVQLPALRAAIWAGTHYCDLGIDGDTMESALQLDQEARQGAVTALLGIGLDPGLSNLLAVHAANQLDEIEDVSVCMFDHMATMGDLSPAPLLARAREAGRVDTSLQDILLIARGPVVAYREGHSVRVEPLENPTELQLPSGQVITGYPVGTSEPVTLPRHLPGVKNVSTFLSIFPPQLNELYLRHGRRIGDGETDPAEAALSFLEDIVADQDRWLSGPSGFPTGWTLWVAATGLKEGRPVRYSCWPHAPISTNGALVACTLRILGGHVGQRGVLSPEACFDPQAFFADVVKVRTPTSEGPLLGESFRYLD